MIIGCSGTRFGMSAAQKRVVAGLLKSFQRDSLVVKIHHGDCVGVDTEFVDIACEIYRCLVHVVCHPPTDESLRAFNTKANETMPPLTYFARNRAIVDASDVLIACPQEMTHQSRGGTWMTVDYCRKKKKPLIIIWPDGSMAAEDENNAIGRGIV